MHNCICCSLLVIRVTSGKPNPFLLKFTGSSSRRCNPELWVLITNQSAELLTSYSANCQTRKCLVTQGQSPASSYIHDKRKIPTVTAVHIMFTPGRDVPYLLGHSEPTLSGAGDTSIVHSYFTIQSWSPTSLTAQPEAKCHHWLLFRA